MLPAVSLGDWFRRLFSPSAGATQAEDQATLREEYGDSPIDQPAPGGGPGLSTTGPPGVGSVVEAEAAEAAAESDEADDAAP